MVDGKRTYDLLLDLLDPKLVKFQFQMSTITAGFVAAEYFLRYPGRFNSMHLQDVDMNGPAPASSKKVRTGRTPPPAPSAGGRRQGQHRLGEDLHRGEDRRGQELLRRADLGAHQAKRRVPQATGGLTERNRGMPERPPGFVASRGRDILATPCHHDRAQSSHAGEKHESWPFHASVPRMSVSGDSLNWSPTRAANRQLSHPSLRYVSRPVTQIDDDLRAAVAEMFQLMYAARGVGLAATRWDCLTGSS